MPLRPAPSPVRAPSRVRARRWVVGGWCWAGVGLLIPVQLVVAAAWPTPYSVTANAISDLGVTSCGTFTEGGALARQVCSPWHPLMNAMTVLAGVALCAGAALLLDAWPRRGWGGAAMGATAAGGLALVAVGLLPWDVAPDGHDVAALAQGVLQWLAMVFLVLAVGGPGGRRRPWPAVRVVTSLTLLLSVVGLVLFLDVVVGGTGLGVPFGLAERLAFDTLTLYSVYLGVLLVRRGGVLSAAARTGDHAA